MVTGTVDRGSINCSKRHPHPHTIHTNTQGEGNGKSGSSKSISENVLSVQLQNWHMWKCIALWLLTFVLLTNDLIKI